MVNVIAIKKFLLVIQIMSENDENLNSNRIQMINLQVIDLIPFWLNSKLISQLFVSVGLCRLLIPTKKTIKKSTRRLYFPSILSGKRHALSRMRESESGTSVLRKNIFNGVEL